MLAFTGAILISIATLSSQFAFAATPAADDPLDFNRVIRPILADNCLPCHGPDKNQRKAGMRLDVEQSALDHKAVVPGKPENSLMVKRITSNDPDFKMPPPDSKLKLTPDEIETLKKWIAEGAVYKPHWAFIPVADVQPPDVPDPHHWIRNPIDTFVLRRLHEEGIKPSPEASRAILLRRVTLDLTGIPPTLDQLDAFLADDSPNAYEKVVDRLLASKDYGQHMANEWMDVARYADTFGYQNDRKTHVWPWRDWVIKAFNENLSYDKFIEWQLAGDLLPMATQEQKLATAFNRLHRQTNEGGSINEEFRVEYVADRVQTFSTAFLGLTMKCARCHDHKFDPMTQKEFYELSAFFDNIDESGLYSHFTEAIPTPALLLYTDDTRKEHHLDDIKIKDAEDHANAVAQDARQRFAQWLAGPKRSMPAPKPVAELPFDSVDKGKTPNCSDPDHPAEFPDALSLVDGHSGKAVHFNGEDAIVCDTVARYERTQPFSIAFWIKAPKLEERMVIFHTTKAASDAASRGYELTLDNGKPTFGLCHFWPGNAVRVQAQDAIPENTWVHLTCTYDGSSRADGLHIYENGQAMAVDVVRDHLIKTILYDNPKDGPFLSLGARFRDAGFKDGDLDDFEVFDRTLTPLEVSAIANNQDMKTAAASADKEAIFAYYLNAVDAPYQEALASLKQARVKENECIDKVPGIMTMRDMPGQRPTYRLSRGAYDQHKERVYPDVPKCVLPFPKDLPRNRLGLAKWLLDPRNPLPSRVAVNRYWQMFFGRGIVETQEDFGTQGTPPTHPDLLDYLAHRFMTSGWDLKALNKLIVMSATYRQDSTPRPDLRERDPFNKLLARGPRHRLPAEEIRDSALAASGLLVDKIGGPSVKPYQPAGLWKEASQVTYAADKGEGLYRRSMYTFLKRTVPPPSMMTFDATNREVCVVRREVTTTPLQALVLLNDPQYVEASRVLAEHALTKYPNNPDARIVMVFRSLLSRRPDKHERSILHLAYTQQRDCYSGKIDEAKAYTSVGETPRDDKLDVVELAATTAVAQLVMNFEEFQVKQ